LPFWICEWCGARLYSAASTLRRPDCPVCKGPLVPAEDAVSPDPAEPAAPGDPEDPDSESRPA
jgi:hypothetical protein